MFHHSSASGPSYAGTQTLNIDPSAIPGALAAFRAAQERVARKVESTEDGKKVVKVVETQAARPIPIQASDIDVALRLDHRQKGLLWYSTYKVGFRGDYEFRNPQQTPQTMRLTLTVQ